MLSACDIANNQSLNLFSCYELMTNIQRIRHFLCSSYLFQLEHYNRRIIKVINVKLRLSTFMQPILTVKKMTFEALLWN